METVSCGDCGYPLDGIPDLSTGERTPCPQCGSKRRAFGREGIVTTGLTTQASELHKRQGETIGYGESASQGRGSGTSLEKNGKVTYSLSGSSPQGEEDTLRACRALVSKLNQLGGDWGEPRCGPYEPIEYEAPHRQDSGLKVSMQVTRAIGDPELWKTLNRTRRIEETGVDKETLADRIKEAIDTKVQKLREADRWELTLVLDATRLPVLGLDVVMKEFHARWGTWAKGLGFEAIWIVGPVEDLTWRVDE